MATSGSQKAAGAANEQPVGVGDALVVIGAVVLFASLFFNWWEGAEAAVSVSAWTALEIADVILAALAVIAIVLSLPAPPGTEEFNRAGAAWLPWLGPVALVIIVVSLVSDPPAVNGFSLAFGAWLGLGGAVLMTIGGLLGRFGVSVSVSSRS